jgi:chaperone required for assembly of F1-ATPase
MGEVKTHQAKVEERKVKIKKEGKTSKNPRRKPARVTTPKILRTPLTS